MIRTITFLSLTAWLLTPRCIAGTVFVDASFIFNRIVFDLRKQVSRSEDLISNAIRFDVAGLDDPKSVHGSLLHSTKRLHHILSAAGFNSTEKFLLVGNSTSGWGEEGRLYWVLKQFFEVDVKILDGGFEALENLKTDGLSSAASKFHSYPLRRKMISTNYSTSFSELRTTSSPILDVRGVLEFSGATPFGSNYGGHIKGAKSVPWDQFFDGEGYLKEKPLFMKSLKGKDAVLYCTAGYRSAMVWAVLQHFEINSKNYDGSWFEYSSKRDE